MKSVKKKNLPLFSHFLGFKVVSPILGMDSKYSNPRIQAFGMNIGQGLGGVKANLHRFPAAKTPKLDLDLDVENLPEPE